MNGTYNSTEMVWAIPLRTLASSP